MDGLLPGAPHTGAIQVVMRGSAQGSEALRGLQGLQGSQALAHGIVQRPRTPLPAARAAARVAGLPRDDVKSLHPQRLSFLASPHKRQGCGSALKDSGGICTSLLLVPCKS